LRIKDISEQQRDDIIEEITKDDVAVNVHFIPMPMLSFFKNQGFEIQNYPQSYKNFQSEISLPVYPQLTNEEVDFIITAIIGAYETIMKRNDSVF